MNRQDGLTSAEADQELLAQLIELETDALTTVFNRYYTPIYRYISFRVDDPETAEDLTSEVFTRLLSALKKRRLPNDTLRGWLFGVAKHVIGDHFRQKRRWSWDALTEFLQSSDEPLDKQAARTMDKELLRQHLSKLNPMQQHILALRFGYGMPVREVATLVGKSEGAVKMLQARAIAMLSREMQS